jgi:hypothetical protein
VIGLWYMREVTRSGSQGDGDSKLSFSESDKAATNERMRMVSWRSSVSVRDEIAELHVPKERRQHDQRRGKTPDK